MTVTTAMTETVLRYINEADATEGRKTEVSGIIAGYPLVDERGEVPYTWDTSTQPPTKTDNADWLATYDLHAAAAEIWGDKAAGFAHLYTFSADGGQYVRSEAHAQTLRMASYHLSRRAAKSARVMVWPKPSVASLVVANLAEETT